MTAPSLSTILATLPPAWAEEVCRYLAIPAWQLRAQRLAERDAAIRAAREVVAPDAWPTRAAEDLAAALCRYQALDAWRIEQHLASLPEGTSPRRVALHRILKLNRGKTLGWRRIYDVFEGEPLAEAGEA